MIYFLQFTLKSYFLSTKSQSQTLLILIVSFELLEHVKHVLIKMIGRNIIK
jgi:hypothetical protein